MTGTASTRKQTKNEKKLRKCKLRIARQKKQLQRLRQALNSKKKKKNIDKKTAIDALKTILPENVVNFIGHQIDLNKKKNKGQRYSKEIKSFALSLFHLSGKAYRLVAKLFCLPSRNTLKRWVSGIPASSGLPKVVKVDL